MAKRRASQTLDGDRISVRIGKDMRSRIRRVHRQVAKDSLGQHVKESAVVRMLIARGLQETERGGGM